jgi:hypothetical protein
MALKKQENKMGLNCPNCKKELAPKMIGDIEIDICENGCKGIWFDEGELKKVRQEPDGAEKVQDMDGQFIPKPKEEAMAEDKRYCPRCNIELYKYNWDMKSDIFLDSCEQCNGMWVDAGELKGMNEYLKNMASRPVPDDEQIKLKLSEIELETQQKMEKDRDENIAKIVDWDLWLFDDMIRFMLKKLTR